MTNEVPKPCRRRAMQAAKAPSPPERQEVVEVATAPETGRVLPPPARELTRGHCANCGAYVGRGVRFHEAKCRGRG